MSMVTLFRIVYFCAALFSIASGALVITSLFIPDRAPQSLQFLIISLVVSTIFLGGGALLLGLQGQVARIATIARGLEAETARSLGKHVNRLLAYLLVGGTFLCALLGVMAYAILARIDQGFAVFS
ncbi:hypothetical protein [Lamprobacter modestohalophilus]|nr:hypothetical protein [Lamprobacter modestohalophilus]